MARMARIVDELRSLEAHGVSDKVVQKLIDSGLAGLAHVLEMSDEDLTSLEGIGPKTAEKVREAATAAKAEWDARDAAWEAERVEAERLAAEEAAEAERLAAEEAAEAERVAAQEAEAAEAEPQAAPEGPEPASSSEAPAGAAPEPAAEGAAATVAGGESGEGGEADGQR
jgi:NAD-dependent DNA ligase